MAVSHEVVTASTGRYADQWKSSVSACKLELEISLPKDSGRDGNGFVDNSLEPTNVQVNARTLSSTALLHPWRTKRRGLAQYGTRPTKKGRPFTRNLGTFSSAFVRTTPTTERKTEGR